MASFLGNSNHQSMMMGLLMYQQVGERGLDYAYIRHCLELSSNPIEFLVNEKLAHRKLANCDEARTKQLLLNDTKNCAVDMEYEEMPYKFEDEDEEEEEEEDEDRAQDRRVEYTYSHPSSPGDNDQGDDDGGRWTQVHTKVAKLLWAIDMVSPGQQQEGQQVCSLRPGCQFQVSICIDEKNQCFYYDCFEYVPCFVDQENSLPTKREVSRFDMAVQMEPTRKNDWGDDDDDEELDQPVQLRTDDIGHRINAHQKAIAGKIFNSRHFRIKIPFKSIQGMLLRVTKKREPTLEDQTGVLILELSKPTNDFAVRSVASAYSQCNQFRRVQDWTGNVASKATRHYIYASIVELQSFVSHLCHLDERLNDMMTPPPQPTKKPRKTKKEGDDKIFWGANNTLGGSDISYSKTPPPSMDKVEDEDEARASGVTPDQVEELFKRIFGTYGSNDCLKAAVLHGHYRLDESITKDTVLYEGKCFGCNMTLAMTWGEALDQPTYAGLDYEEGGQDACVRCENCGGNYLTSLCSGDPEFDCGKSHNHCTECPNFGVCIRDYRMAHCEHCNEHYFCGLSGFKCPACGDGKAKKQLSEMTESMPSLTAWNGQAQGRELVREILSNNEDYAPLLMRMAMLMGAL